MKSLFRPKFNSFGKSKQKGQALVEYAIYAVIALVAIAGIAYFAFTSNNNTNVNKTVTTLQTVIAGTQKLYAGDANGFSNISIASMVNNGLVPSGQVQQGVWVAPVGGTITVAPASLYGTNGDSFTLTLPEVPVSQCSALAQALASNYPEVAVGGTDIVNVPGGVAYSAAAVGNACSAGNNGNIAFAITAGRS